jgi:dTDP-4-dehydrorhamnose reductase
MKILITGASGFLGWHISRELANNHRVYAIANRHSPVIAGVDWIPFDLRNTTGLDRIFDSAQPDVFIHAAAMTNVRECEANRHEAMKVNIKATERIAEQCERNNVYLIYISTDLVFDGLRGNYSEEDSTNPISFYARTKRVAEEVVQSFVPHHTIVRMALLYGPPAPHSRSFLGWMGDGFREGKPVTLFTDQFRTPLYSGDAVGIIEELLARKGQPPDIKLIHAAGPERLSRVEIGRIYCEVFGYDRSLIKEIRMSEKGEVTNDAPDVSLSIEKAKTFLDFKPKSVREGIEDIYHNRTGKSC